jgi:hypothetical protein
LFCSVSLVFTRCSIFADLPETFEVARYHSLHGIKEHLPDDLKVTALSEDGIVMGIQHATLPFAAVQFHPESILTSPSHGMKILENAMRSLTKGSGDDLSPKSGAEIVWMLERLSTEQVKAKLDEAGLVSSGSKSEMIVRVALFTHKSTEAKAGRLQLSDLSLGELQDLKTGIGLKTESSTKEDMIGSLEKSLLA